MDELSLSPAFLRNLILQLRALMAQEEEVSPDSGSNPIDDEGPATLQDTPDNLLRAGLEVEIEDLEPDQQAELVALMWIGRGDMEPEEWGAAVRLAREREEASSATTADWLLGIPNLGDLLDEGLNAIGRSCA